MTDRLNLYLSDDLAALITERSAAPQHQNVWIRTALQRYDDLVKEAAQELRSMLTAEDVSHIVKATTNRAYDHNVIHWLVISRAGHLSAVMQGLTLTQRCALAEACDRYHRRRLAGEDVQPTLDGLFN